MDEDLRPWAVSLMVILMVISIVMLGVMLRLMVVPKFLCYPNLLFAYYQSFFKYPAANENCWHRTFAQWYNHTKHPTAPEPHFYTLEKDPLSESTSPAPFMIGRVICQWTTAATIRLKKEKRRTLNKHRSQLYIDQFPNSFTLSQSDNLARCDSTLMMKKTLRGCGAVSSITPLLRNSWPPGNDAHGWSADSIMQGN